MCYQHHPVSGVCAEAGGDPVTGYDREGKGAPAPDPVYPLPKPAGRGDRAAVGLALDVAELLEKHGYPPVTSGPDLARLYQALYRFLYKPEVTE